MVGGQNSIVEWVLEIIRMAEIYIPGGVGEIGYGESVGKGAGGKVVGSLVKMER